MKQVNTARDFFVVAVGFFIWFCVVLVVVLVVCLFSFDVLPFQICYLKSAQMNLEMFLWK